MRLNENPKFEDILKDINMDGIQYDFSTSKTNAIKSNFFVENSPMLKILWDTKRQHPIIGVLHENNDLNKF